MTCAPLFFYFFLIVFFFRGESMTSKVHMTCRILFFPAKTSFCLDDSVGAFSPRGIQFLQVFRGSRVCCSLLQRPLPGVSCLDILWRLVKAFWIVSCAAACCISCSSRFRPCAGLSRAFWHLVRLTRASVLSPTAVQLVAGVGKRVSWPSREGWGSVFDRHFRPNVLAHWLHPC